MLLEAHNLPILTYAMTNLDDSDRDDRDDKRQMRVAFNAVYRKMFGCTRVHVYTEESRNSAFQGTR